MGSRTGQGHSQQRRELELRGAVSQATAGPGARPTPPCREVCPSRRPSSSPGSLPCNNTEAAAPRAHHTDTPLHAHKSSTGRVMRLLWGHTARPHTSPRWSSGPSRSASCRWAHHGTVAGPWVGQAGSRGQRGSLTSWPSLPGCHSRGSVPGRCQRSVQRKSG